MLIEINLEEKMKKKTTWQNCKKVNFPVASSSTSPAYPSMSSFLHSTPIDFRII